MKSLTSWISVGKVIGVVVLLLLLSSCSRQAATLASQPLPLDEPDGKPQSFGPLIQSNLSICGNVTCDKNQVCARGVCGCLDGFKSCKGACIPKTVCCTEKDCQATESCVGNQCQFSCSKIICQTNQVCDESQKRCTCPENYRFCEVQHKCIPTDHCCDKFDCGRGLICIATINSARVCLYTKSPVCKYFGDKSSKIFGLNNNQTVDVTAAEFLYGQKVKLVVDGKPFELENGSREVLEDGITLQVDDVREIGGTCRVPKEREKI